MMNEDVVIPFMPAEAATSTPLKVRLRSLSPLQPHTLLQLGLAVFLLRSCDQPEQAKDTSTQH